MNSRRSQTSLGGAAAASDINQESELLNPDSKNGDMMKRATARQLIERYYYQLTDGCGNDDCSNEFCASSNIFTYKQCTRNQLAVQALQLFKQKAKICEAQPAKVAKWPTKTDVSKNEVKGLTSNSVKLSRQNAANMVPTTDRPSTSRVKTGNSRQDLASGKKNFLTEEKLASIIHECEKDSDWSKLIRTIGALFHDPEALILSFRKKADDSLPKECRRALEQDLDKDRDEQIDVKDCTAQGSCSSKPDNKDSLSEVTVDVASVHRAFTALMKIQHHPFQDSLINALISLSRMLDVELKYHKPLDNDPDYINIFIIVMEIPFLHNPEFTENAFPNLCNVIGQLPLHAQVKLVHVWSKYSSERLQEMVRSLHQLITVRVINGENQWGRSFPVNEDLGITGSTKVMKILYYASIYGGVNDSEDLIAEEKLLNDSDYNFHNFLGAVAAEPKEYKQPKEDILAKELGIRPVDCRKPLVPFEDFVNDPLNEFLDVGTDFGYYKSESGGRFSFADHSFILTTASKYTVMYLDNRIHMLNERRTSLLQTFVHGTPIMPYLRIKVRRDHIIDDALVGLEMVAMENPQDLKKQLFVEFEGEQGVDEGGVSKEFFQLVVEDIFNPDIGMFTYNEETMQFWFNPTSFENDGQFTLIGIVLGLAIYNSAILDIHFPMVVYRKLMGKKGTFKDLEDVDPTLSRSLQSMLDFEGNVDEAFMQSFRIGYKDVFGNSITHDLKDKGDEILVTNENRQDFVDLYANFLLNQSVEKQFKAFKRGFLMVINDSPLQLLFRPEEVELLVCGCKHLDFHALEEATEYDGGFSSDSPTIRNFWSVLHDFTEEQKKKFLQFTTGSDRVPIGGLAKLKLVITRNGPDSDRLPTSHTCFNVLLLPDYSNKNKLQDRLLKAINYSKGFGML